MRCPFQPPPVKSSHIRRERCSDMRSELVSVLVQSPAPPHSTASQPGVSWLFIVVAVAVVAVIGGGLFLRRRK